MSMEEIWFRIFTKLCTRAKLFIIRCITSVRLLYKGRARDLPFSQGSHMILETDTFPDRSEAGFVPSNTL